MKRQWPMFVVLTIIVLTASGQISCWVRNIDEKLDATTNTILSALKPTVLESEECSTHKLCSNNFSLVLMNTTSYLMNESAQIVMKHSFQVVDSNKMEYPCGLSIQTYPGMNFSLCFPAISGQYNVAFHLECYKNVTPGTFYLTSVSPLFQKTNIQISYKIPDCNYSNFRKAKACTNLFFQIPSSCKNRSITVNYEIKLYSTLKASATLRLCQKGDFLCLDIFGANSAENLPLKGTINLSLPADAPEDEEYFVEMWYVSQYGASDERKRQNVTKLLKTCIVEEDTGLPIELISIAIVFCIIFIVLAIGIGLHKSKYNLGFLPKWLKKERRATRKEPEYLLLNYVNDNSKHLDVVLRFASFLALDMGFRVKFEKYEREKFCSDPISWMKTSFEMSSKVLFVWSPGATKQWNMQSCGNSQKEMFSLILSKAIADIEMSSVKNKYFVIHFEYWDADIIPKQFKSKPFNYFSLVKDIKQFHCKLKKPLKSDKTPGCLSTDISSIPFDFPNTNYGNTLSEAIKAVKAYAKTHPNGTTEDSLKIGIKKETPT